jgi:hypothetical protein
MLVPGVDAPLAIDLRFKGGAARFEGREALRITAAVIPHVNRFGGATETIQSAVSSLDEAGGVEGYLQRLRTSAATATAVTLKPTSRKRKTRQSWSGAYNSGLFGLSTPDRLALEMALHEEAELRALQGELAELERAWRDAEEIAAIADGLLSSPGLQTRLEDLRRKVDKP